MNPWHSSHPAQQSGAKAYHTMAVQRQCPGNASGIVIYFSIGNHQTESAQHAFRLTTIQSFTKGLSYNCHCLVHTDRRVQLSASQAESVLQAVLW